MYIKLLNKLKVVYFLGFGSELGALRNGGIIENDHDIDIIIPVWLNYEIFKCNEYIEFYSNECKIISDSKAKICNRTKHSYMILFRNYIVKELKKDIYYKCIYINKVGYTSCWMLKYDNYFIDVWIFIGNEYFYRNIKICRCKFSNIISFCTVNALDYIYKNYGNKWKIPIKQGNGDYNCLVILYPNITNSKIKKTNTFSLE